MNTYTIKKRVYYHDTDCGGVVYYSNYLKYFEEARTDLVRAENYPYKKIEDDGIILPVSDARLQYKSPLEYDEEYLVETNTEYVKNMSTKFLYKIKKNDGTIVCEGYTVHAFINKDTKDFEYVPEELKSILQKYLFKKK